MAISEYDLYLLTEKTAKNLREGKNVSLKTAFSRAAKGLGIRTWSSESAKKAVFDKIAVALAERSAAKKAALAKQKAA